MPAADAAVNAIDLVYYAPHVIRGANSEDDVQSIIDSDTSSLASSLRSFLSSDAGDRVGAALQLPVTDDAGSSASTLSRRKFRLWELLDDVVATQTSTFLMCAAPASPDPLALRPLVACSIQAPWITIEDPVPNIVPNFKSGNTVVLESPVSGKTRHTIDQVDGIRLLLRNSDALQGRDVADIVAVESTDPVRILKIQAFHDWRGAADADVSPGTISSFNEGLYKLLYAPSDPSLANLGSEEMYTHYIDHPGSVGSLADLLAVAALADTQDRTRIESRLIMNPGASIEFGAPMDGTVAGVVTAARTNEEYGADVGVDQDMVVPTSAAVRSMIRDAVPGPDAEHYTRYLEVEDVLYAGVEYEGVHCPGRLSVDRDVQCDEFECTRVARMGSALCGDARVGELTAESIDARVVSISGGVTLSETDVCVSAPMMRARACVLEELSVSGDVKILEGLQVDGCVTASRFDVSDRMACKDVECTSMYVNGDVSATGLCRVEALEVGGVDIGKDLADIWAAIGALSRRVPP